MMRIIIYEDNKDFALYLENLIDSILSAQKYNKIAEVVMSTESDLQVLEYLNQYPEDMLFFVDICVPEKPLGIELAAAIKAANINNNIVFVTDYPEKLKFDSASKLEMLNSIQKDSVLFEKEIYLTIMKAIELNKKSNIIIINNNYCELNPIRTQNIIFIEHVKNSGNICIWHMDGSIEWANTLKNVKTLLDNRFFQINRSIIVNMDKIKKINTFKREIFLQNDMTFNFSMFFGKGFLKAYYAHIKPNN